MVLNLSVNKTNEANILVLVCAIGLLEVENDLLRIEDCDQYLFSPYSLDILQRKGIDQSIIDIVHLGTEIEDIESLLPYLLEKNIRELQEAAKEQLKLIQSKEKKYELKSWVDEDTKRLPLSTEATMSARGTRKRRRR